MQWASLAAGSPAPLLCGSRSCHASPEAVLGWAPCQAGRMAVEPDSLTLLVCEPLSCLQELGCVPFTVTNLTDEAGGTRSSDPQGAALVGSAAVCEARRQ